VGGPESRDGEHLRCDNELRRCNNNYHQFINSQKYKIRILFVRDRPVSTVPVLGFSALQWLLPIAAFDWYRRRLLLLQLIPREG